MEAWCVEHFVMILDHFRCVYLCIVAFRGSGLGAGSTDRAGSSDEEIHWIIVSEVVMVIRETILEFFGSLKTALIEEFDRCYVVVVQDAAAATTTTIAIAGL